MTRPDDATTTIEDGMDPALDPFRAVRDKDRRADGGRFVVEAPRVVSRFLEAVAEDRFQVEAIALDPGVVPPTLLEDAAASGATCVRATSDALDDASGYRFHAGAIAIGRRPRRLPGLEELLGGIGASGPATLCGLVGVTSMDNIGGIFRAAAALGVGGILLDAACCDPLLRRCLRISMGQVFRMPWAIVDDLVPAIERLRNEKGITTLAIENLMDAPLLHEAPPPSRVLLAIGNEGHGLPPEVLAASDGARRIAGPPELPESERPGGADERSLNAHVAAAIAFHESLRRGLGGD